MATGTESHEVFDCSGPLHLTVIDWNNPNHQRSVAASLVKGAYMVEYDRQEDRSEQNAQAPPWWEFFNFQLNKVLVDPEDQSVFGCIYQLKNPKPNSPKFVVAFRGTIITQIQDLKLDLKVIMNRLHRSPRFRVGFQCVKALISDSGLDYSDIWIAGHSLGSAIALLIGRGMVKLGFHLKTYLFNPPFISLPFDQVPHRKLERGARFLTSVLTAGVAAVSIVVGKRDREFGSLSAWVPHLFVNPADPICSEYIGHFEHREKMVALAGVRIANLAAQNSVDAFDLLPSAYVTTNASDDKISTFLDLKQKLQNHGLQQWWRPDIDVKGKLYGTTGVSEVQNASVRITQQHHN